MWTAIKWTIDKTTISCTVRKGDQRKLISFPLSTIALVDMPSSLGAQDECIDLLSNTFATSNVTCVNANTYRVIYDGKPPDCVPSTFRNIKILKPSIANLLSIHQLHYHSVFDDSGHPIELTDNPNSVYTPRTCFWSIHTIPEKENYAPIPELNPIVAVAFGTNYSPDIEVFTTLDPELIAQTNATHFTNELQMLEHLFTRIMSCDINVGFDLHQYEFPFLIKRLKHLKPEIFTALGCEIKTKEYQSEFGAHLYQFLENYVCDHVDLLQFVRVAYPYLVTHTLSEFSQHLLDRKAVEVEFRSSVTKALNAVSYNCQILKDLWNLVFQCFSYIVDKTGVAYSEVGTKTEVEAFLFRFKPELLLGPQGPTPYRLHDSYMDRGLYNNVGVYSLCPIMVDGLKDSSDRLTQEIGNQLVEYPFLWLVSHLFQHPKLHPNKILEHGGVVGMSSSVVFTTVKLSYPQLSSYKQFAAVATGSWIGKNDSTFTHFGLSKACTHPCMLFKREVESIFDSYFSGVKITNIREYISTIAANEMELFVRSVRVTTSNAEKYLKLLSREDIRALSEHFVPHIKINYVMTFRGPELASTATLDIVDKGAYSAELYRILQCVPVRV